MSAESEPILEAEFKVMDQESSEETKSNAPSIWALSDRELSRLVAFDSVLRRMHETRGLNREEKRPNYGFTDSKGKVVDVFFRLDEKFSSIMAETADRMWQSDFSRNARLSSAAKNIAENLKNEFDPAGGGLPMEADVFNRIWEADKTTDERE